MGTGDVKTAILYRSVGAMRDRNSIEIDADLSKSNASICVRGKTTDQNRRLIKNEWDHVHQAADCLSSLDDRAGIP